MAKTKTTKKAGSRMAKPIVGKGAKGGVKKNGMVVRRADLGADVGLYFRALSSWQQKAAKQLDVLVKKTAPKATGAIKWGMPVYEQSGMLCYIRSQAKYLTFGFYDAGTGLDDPRGVLEGTGQSCRHVKIHGPEEMDEAYLGGLLKQAVRINEMGA